MYDPESQSFRNSFTIYTEEQRHKGNVFLTLPKNLGLLEDLNTRS